MKSKKINKIIGPVSGVLGFMLMMGAVSAPAYASDVSMQNECLYNNVLLDKGNVNSNNVIEQNGIKLTVNNIIGTKNEITADIKIESDANLDEINHSNMELNVYMDKVKRNGGGSSWSYSEDGKTINVKVDINSKEDFPATGAVRVDLVLGDKDFNGSLKIPVDFTESFKKVIEKDINSSIENTDKTIDKFVTNAIGTKIIASEPEGEGRFSFRNRDKEMIYVLKCDDKMYSEDDWSSRYNFDDESKIIKETEFEGVNYDDLKDCKEISITPIKVNLSDNDTESLVKDDTKEDDRVTGDNVKYQKTFEFNDKTKGTIKAEKNNDSIKFYCKADSYEKSLLMAIGMNATFVKEIGNDEFDYLGRAKKVIYKDSNDENATIVEFKNEYPDAILETYIDSDTKFNDKFEFNKEIKIQ